MRIQRFDEHRPMPWANGRGTSYEVARGGGDPWSWRVAIAPVVEDGPFSSLSGVDRWLVVLDDAPITMVVGGTERIARKGDVVAFAGEAQVDARIPFGPTRDCGLMVRRGAATGSMQVAGPGSVRATVLVALEPASVRADDEEVTLSPGDALLSHDPCDALVVAGRAVVVTVTATLPTDV